VPSNGTTKVRARSRLYDRCSDVSEGPQSGKLGLVTGCSSTHYVSPDDRGQNRVPGGLVASHEGRIGDASA